MTGPAGPGPSGPAGPGPGRPDFRCADETPHGPHPVRPRRLALTPFDCAGYPGAAAIEGQLDAAFGRTGSQPWPTPDPWPNPPPNPPPPTR